MTGVVETESGETTGPKAPRFIVKNIEFLSSPANIIKTDVKFIDFDQSFLISSPPQKVFATPVNFPAPEVAVEVEGGPANDVRALGCCIFRLRSGEGTFSNPFQVTAPSDSAGVEGRSSVGLSGVAEKESQQGEAK